MAIAFVQKSSAFGEWAGNKTASPTLPSPSTANNLIVIPYSQQQYDPASATIAASGYSAANDIAHSGNISRAGVLYKIAAGATETPSVIVTTAGTAGNCFGATCLAEFSGVDTSSPYVAADSNGSQATTTTPTVSTSDPLSQDESLIIACFSGNTTFAGATTPPSGFTTLFESLSYPYGLYYRIVTNNAQITAALGTISAASCASTVTVFKAATVSGVRKKGGLLATVYKYI